MSGPAPPNTVRELDRLLSAHDLHQGIGGYWIASLATVESNGAVTVRPVLAAQDGGIKRQALLSSDAWYEGRKFQFVVFGAPAGYRGLRARTLPWGSPRYVHVVGPYRVLVWDHDLRVRVFGQPETAAAGRARLCCPRIGEVSLSSWAALSWKRIVLSLLESVRALTHPSLTPARRHPGLGAAVSPLLRKTR